MGFNYNFKIYEEGWEKQWDEYAIAFPLTIPEVRDKVKEHLMRFQKQTIRLQENKTRMRNMALTEARMAHEADELEYKYLKEFGYYEKESFLREQIGWCKEFLKKCKVI